MPTSEQTLRGSDMARTAFDSILKAHANAVLAIEFGNDIVGRRFLECAEGLVDSRCSKINIRPIPDEMKRRYRTSRGDAARADVARAFLALAISKLAIMEDGWIRFDGRWMEVELADRFIMAVAADGPDWLTAMSLEKAESALKAFRGLLESGAGVKATSKDAVHGALLNAGLDVEHARRFMEVIEEAHIVQRLADEGNDYWLMHEQCTMDLVELLEGRIHLIRSASVCIDSLCDAVRPGWRANSEREREALDTLDTVMECFAPPTISGPHWFNKGDGQTSAILEQCDGTEPELVLDVCRRLVAIGALVDWQAATVVDLDDTDGPAMKRLALLDEVGRRMKMLDDQRKEAVIHVARDGHMPSEALLKTPFVVCVYERIPDDDVVSTLRSVANRHLGRFHVVTVREADHLATLLRLGIKKGAGLAIISGGNAVDQISRDSIDLRTMDEASIEAWLAEKLGFPMPAVEEAKAA